MATENKFEIIGNEDISKETLARPSMTYWEDAWRRLRTNKIAIASLVVLAIIAVMSIIGPHINEFNYEEIDPSKINETPNSVHWFGVDELGRDIFSRVWQAGRVSLIIGITGALIASFVGTIYGAVSALAGGQTDNIMMRIVEVLSSVPYLIIVILISVISGNKGLGSLILALTLTGWCNIARIVRGEMLKITNSDFVLAARALGVSPWKIIKDHLTPNTMGVIIVAITFDIPGYIFAESFLSYVGLGVQAPNTSWGALAASAQQNLMFYPHQLFFPALLIALTMLAFTLLGDGLRDALDPRLRE